MADEQFENEVLEKRFHEVEEIVRMKPKTLRHLKKLVNDLSESIAIQARADELAKAWYPTVPWEHVQELATRMSNPFLVVMNALHRRNYRTVPTSLLLWWRRLVSTGQTHHVSYFSMSRFDSLFSERKPSLMVTGTDIERCCCDTEEVLKAFTDATSDPMNTEFHLRELLGISMASDIRKAWKDWAKRNHPDKGGDNEKFLEVKLTFDEWNETNSTKENKK